VNGPYHPAPQSSDFELIRLVRAGDDSAFHELVDRHARKLFRAALCLTPTRSDAEDLFQETLLAAYRGLGNFNEQSSVKTWMMSIMMRQAGRSWRQLRRARQIEPIRPESQTPENPDAALATPSAAEGSDRRIDLLAVLNELTPERRAVITLRDLQGLSYDEIAQALGIPRGTVESRLHRARSDLRELLADYAPPSSSPRQVNHGPL
jgi:RNA polymerase sigma-70 factor (ECF subfamily)